MSGESHMLLQNAVKARLPLVAVTTTDLMNLPEVLATVLDEQVFHWQDKMPFLPNTTHYYLARGKPSQESELEAMYAQMIGLGSTMIVVNPAKAGDTMFNAGEVPVPKELLVKFFTAVTDDKAKAEALLPALGGVTLKTAAELARLTMAREGSLTLEGLTATRKMFFMGSRGLTQVTTDQAFYAPPQFLSEWIEQEKWFFLKSDEPRLIPRGVLADGPPGVGKTEAARYIARQWGVPLYRVDVGGVKNKYVGQSEENMLRAFGLLDREEPCVALFDEVEKVFGDLGEHDGGTTTAMLSQTLWWLAERRSRVLVVMTTNKRSKLPPELYREGRIDNVMEFHGLAFKEACHFVAKVATTFIGLDDKPVVLGDKAVMDLVGDCVKNHPLISAAPSGSGATVSQALLTKAVTTAVKQLVLGQVEPKAA